MTTEDGTVISNYNEHASNLKTCSIKPELEKINIVLEEINSIGN